MISPAQHVVYVQGGTHTLQLGQGCPRCAEIARIQHPSRLGSCKPPTYSVAVLLLVPFFHSLPAIPPVVPAPLQPLAPSPMAAPLPGGPLTMGPMFGLPPPFFGPPMHLNQAAAAAAAGGVGGLPRMLMGGGMLGMMMPIPQGLLRGPPAAQAQLPPRHPVGAAAGANAQQQRQQQQQQGQQQHVDPFDLPLVDDDELHRMNDDDDDYPPQEQEEYEAGRG